MTYKSLYRKYRPITFDDVSGQRYIITTLGNAIANNKISHAYLFTGTRGTGKTTIAKIFAKLVNCPNMKENKPCGKCEICLCNNTDEIPDIIEIDAASNNGVDEIRELKNKIKLVPVACKYKVYIIDEVHMLSTGAFNALLKTLEEPPEHVIFILATTEPQKLPITIVSRCQRFDFKRLTIEDIEKRLKYIAKQENIDVDDYVLEEIAKMSDGAMRDAIGTLDQVASYSDNKITIEDIYMVKGSISSKELIELVNLYIIGDESKLLDKIDNIYNDGKNFLRLVEDMLFVFRNILVCKKAPKYFKNKNFSLKDEIKEMSEKIELNELMIILKKFEEMSRKIEYSNYPRILLETCMLSNEVCQPKNVTPNSEEKPSNDEILDNSDNVIKNLIVSNNKCSTETKIILNLEENDKKILINNTIALATNKCKKEVQEALLLLDNYLIDKKYKTPALVLKDAEVAAASDDHVLLTYKYESMVDDNDKEIKNIAKLLEKIIGKKYKLVAITTDKWKEERPYYIKLKKEKGKIVLLEEIKEQKQEKIENTPIDDIVDIFGSDIIEMEG